MAVVVETNYMTYSMNQLEIKKAELMEMIKSQDDAAVWRIWAEVDKEIGVRNHPDRGYTRYHNAVARLEIIELKVAHALNYDFSAEGVEDESQSVETLVRARTEMLILRETACRKWIDKNGCLCDLNQANDPDCVSCNS